MDPSSATLYHAETSNRLSRTSQTRQQQYSGQDTTYNFVLPADWDVGQPHTYTISDTQPETGVQPGPSSIPRTHSTAYDHRPSWTPIYPIVADHQQRTEARGLAGLANDQTGQDGEREPWLDWLVTSLASAQSGSDGSITDTRSTMYAAPQTDYSVDTRPGLVHSAASSASTSSSTQSSDIAGEMHNIYQQSLARPLVATSDYMSGLSGFPMEQVDWVSESGLFAWPTQERPSDPTSYVTPSWLDLAARLTRSASSQDLSTSSAQQSSSRPPYNPQPSQIANAYPVPPQGPSQVRPSINTTPLHSSLALQQPSNLSPMISPLTMTTSGTFQRYQADAVSRMAGIQQTNPTITRTRRRSAIYYRHGRKVADSTIEVHEDVEDTPAPISSPRSRTISCDSGLQTRKHLGDITNRSHAISGASSRAQPRKKGGSTSSASSELHALVELPDALSNLAWVNDGFGPCDAAENGQQRDALSLLDKLREDLENGSRSHSTSHAAHAQSRKGPTRSR